METSEHANSIFQCEKKGSFLMSVILAGVGDEK